MTPEDWGEKKIYMYIYFITQFRDQLLVVILCFGKLFQRHVHLVRKDHKISQLNNRVLQDMYNKEKKKQTKKHCGSNEGAQKDTLKLYM